MKNGYYVIPMPDISTKSFYFEFRMFLKSSTTYLASDIEVYQRRYFTVSDARSHFLQFDIDPGEHAAVGDAP
jgi:hypothetical protein